MIAEGQQTIVAEKPLDLADALKEAISRSKKRNFTQTMEAAINLQDLDLKKPENIFTEEVTLPAGRGKQARVGVIGSGLAIKAKDVADELLDEAALAKIEADKKALRVTVSRVDFFLAEAPLMLRIGRSLGKVLGPRGLMPKPIAPGADPKDIVARLKNTVRVRITSGSAVIHCPLGTEAMPEDKLTQNFEAVMAALEKRLPRGKQNIKSVYVKTTMGPAVRVKIK